MTVASRTPAAGPASGLSNLTNSAWFRLLFLPGNTTWKRGAPAAELRLLRCLDLAVLGLYASVLFFAIPHHLASDDEAQAWLLARDNSVHDLLLYRMHYEGGPGLWPLILKVAQAFHMPFQAVSWIGATAAIAGVAVLLAAAPLPRIFRWLLPFTFFLQYQYAVIARPYTLFPLLLFLLCILYTADRPKPILFAIVAGLMANISLHGAMLAGFFSLLYLRQFLRDQAPLPAKDALRRLVPAASVFLVLALLSAFVAFPAPDVCTDGFAGDTSGTSHPAIRRLLPSERLPPNAPPLDPFLQPDLSADGHTKSPIPPPNPVLLAIGKMILFGGDAALFPLSTSNLLALAFLACLWLWLRSRGRLELLLPFCLSILLASQVLILDHHSGLFLLALVAAIWIALDLPPAKSQRPQNTWFAPALTAAALTIATLQIGWSIHTIRVEATHPYDPGLATEQFIAQHLQGKRVAGFGYATVTTQAYASHNLFFNQPHAYWVWSAQTFINRRRTEALLQHPDAVVLEEFISEKGFFFNQVTLNPTEGAHAFRQTVAFWQQHGYRIDKTFCGERLMRNSAGGSACELVLLPNPNP